MKLKSDACKASMWRDEEKKAQLKMKLAREALIRGVKRSTPTDCPVEATPKR